MSIFIIILYISAFSAFRAYEVGVTRKGLPASLFAKASPFVVTTALLSESRNIIIIVANPPHMVPRSSAGPVSIDFRQKVCGQKRVGSSWAW